MTAPSRARAIRVVSPGGSIGYGVNADSLQRAVASGLDVIGADSGSTDMGPYYLGSGRPYHSRATMKRDMSLIIEAGLANGLPVLMLHGGGQTRRSWKPSLQTLAGLGYRGYCLDARGHGVGC